MLRRSLRFTFAISCVGWVGFAANVRAADELAVDEPLVPYDSWRVRPADLLQVDRNDELAADEPLAPYDSWRVRPADLLEVDRNHELFAPEKRSTYEPSSRPTKTMLFGAGMNSRRANYVRLIADEKPATTKAAKSDDGTPMKFEDAAVSLDSLEKDGVVAQWYAKLDTANGPTKFGELVVLDSEGEVDETKPTVAIIGGVRGVTDVALPLKASSARGAGWMFVASGPREGDIWGVLDALHGDANPSLTIARSGDNGVTWTTTSMQKPSAKAEFSTMALDDAGKGRLTFYLSEADGDHKPGYYPMVTADFGKTWSAGEFERDNLVVADEVTDDDMNSAAPARRVTATYYGGHGWTVCHRPVVRPYGKNPGRGPGARPVELSKPTVFDMSRVKALQNPGFDDRMQ